eukprot:m.132568 g.132568  ORF g.132568 m.132568 type:complete len:534 (-) comp22459_c0_seq1:165-1766(-)
MWSALAATALLVLGSAAPSAASSASVQPCAQSKGRIIGRGSIAQHIVESAAECCALCQATDRCRAFTWAKPGSSCWLKDNVQDCGSVANTTSGTCDPLPLGPCQPPPRPPYPQADTLPRCAGFPDPFRTADGHRVASGPEWTAHRQDMIGLLEHYMMGHSPPRSAASVRGDLVAAANISTVCDRVSCQPVAATLRNYTLHVGPPNATQTHPFDLFVYIPAGHKGSAPVFVYSAEGFYGGEGFGDLTAVGLSLLLARGYAVASFNRNQLRMDDGPPGCKSPADPGSCFPSPDGVQRLYPEYDWGTIATWAWGATRVVDFLLADTLLSTLLDKDQVMTMGHSRGGKTALWHGATDERISATFPLMSGEGGCGAIRVSTPAAAHPTKGEDTSPSETIADIVRSFPNWFGENFGDFSADPLRAPWDQHWSRMLIAPRAQLGVEGLHNEHENPVGSQASYTATQVIYDWFGVPNRNGVHFHPGAHPMDDQAGEHDWVAVADFADWIQRDVEPRNVSEFNTTAYPVDRPFNWTAPSTPP